MRIEENKGITLIALVVTIIVLIILATISIAIVFGEGGVIEKAREAKQMQLRAEEKEQLEQIKINMVIANLGNITVNKYIDELVEKGIVKSSDVTDNGDGTKTIVTTNKLVATIKQDGVSNVIINAQGSSTEEIPDATQELKFENLNTVSGQTSVTVRKLRASSYKIQYKVNDQEYREIEDGGTIQNLSSSDIVTVSLTDGTNSGATKILNVATGLKKIQKLSEEKESLELIKSNALINNLGTLSVDQYIAELVSQKKAKQENVTANDDGTKTVITESGYSVNVKQDGASNVKLTVEPVL